MMVQLRKAYNGLPVSWTGDMPSGVAAALISRGVAVEIKPQTLSVDYAATNEPVPGGDGRPNNRAMSAPERRA